MTKLALWDGELIPEEELSISPFSATATYGLNVFEGLRAYWRPEMLGHALAFAELHLQRLLESAKILGIQHPYGLRSLKEHLLALVKVAPPEDVVIRMTLMLVGSPGESWNTDVEANLAIRFFSSPSRLSERRQVSAMTSSWRRPGLSAIPMSVKSGANYLNSRYAFLQARSCGADMPLLLDDNSYVVEGAGANLVCRKDREIYLCPPELPVLRGITQNHIRTSAVACGNYSVLERPMTLPELYICDEVLLVGTTAEVVSVVAIDGRQIGEDADASLSDFARQALREAVQSSNIVAGRTGDDV